ncbi:MAG: M15 family metallopeptidase [Spirochaetota bacterium]
MRSQRVLLLLLLVIPLPASAETLPPGPPAPLAGFRSAEEMLRDDASPFAARTVLDAIAAAYPRRVERVGWRDGQWAILIAGEWFYWAGGRLLRESELLRADSYDPIPFYRYEPGPAVSPDLDEHEKRALEARVAEQERNPPRRHPGFLNALWRIRGEGLAYERQKTTFFLGFKTMVHREILEDLAAVEEEIIAAMRADSELAAFVRRLRTIEGYNYRRVDGTATLSYHSYGIAVDFIPEWYGGRQVYWRWARGSGLEWHSVAQEDRFVFPEAFVAAFERHGFVWGGKWTLYDTIHFEYRPEILILNGFEVDLR